MDRLVEAVAKYLRRHRSVGLFRLTPDLTRRRLAEVGAVEVVKGVVAPPTPGTETWWRAVAAVREAVYALRERGLAQARRRGQLDGPALLINPTPNCQLRRMAYLSRFSSFFRFRETPKNGVSILPNAA